MPTECSSISCFPDVLLLSLVCVCARVCTHVCVCVLQVWDFHSGALFTDICLLVFLREE